jgi:hypothetical protein
VKFLPHPDLGGVLDQLAYGAVKRHLHPRASDTGTSRIMPIRATCASQARDRVLGEERQRRRQWRPKKL